MSAPKSLGRRTMEVLFVAVVYYVGARLGYGLAFLDTIVSPVWPAAGIALGLVILLGYHVSVGILLGAAVAGYQSTPDLGLVLGTSTASSIGPVVNALIISRLLGDRRQLFNSVRKVVLFIFVCVPVGAVASALVGTATVYLNGYGASGAVWWTVLTWFTGDVQGYIIFGSLVLVWATKVEWESPRREIPEAIVLILLIAVTSVLAFRTPYPLAYAPILFLIWGAIRFKLHGATVGGVIVTVIAVVLTSGADGPFIVQDGGTVLVNQSLLLLQLYVALIALSTLLFGSAVVELKDVREDKGRIEGELDAARQIQFSLVPNRFPAFPERKDFDVHATLVPARHVGGDFYDFFFTNDDTLCVCVGDVAGKGVAAALFMAVTTTLIRTNAVAGLSTDEIMTQVNTDLSRNNPSATFVTIFVGLLNVKSGEFTYTNAGHNPPYLVRHGGTRQRLDTRHGPIAGAVDNLTYTKSVDTLRTGDTLFIFTDGVTEAMNGAGDLFTEGRLVTHLDQLAEITPQATNEEVFTSVKEFEGPEQTDDITMLTLRYGGNGPVLTNRSRLIADAQ